MIFNTSELYYYNISDEDDMRVANVSAWGKQTPSVLNQQIRENLSEHSPRRDEKGGIVDLWSSANLELEAKQKREQERKVDVSVFLFASFIIIQHFNYHFFFCFCIGSLKWCNLKLHHQYTMQCNCQSRAFQF